MRTVRTVQPGSATRERLGLKLPLLFVGTLLAVLLVIVVWALFSNLVAGRRAADEADIQAPVFAIDPKIQTDLAKAMSFDAIPASTDVQNPFIDRAGIGSNITVTLATANVDANNSVNLANGTGSRVTSVPGIRPTVTNIVVPEVDNTKARYEDWINRQRSGYLAGPESETLGIDDLVPVGYADGGDRGPEVILFSISLCRTFSFPVGTQFYNGTLTEIKPAEVVFAVPNGIRRKSYSVEHPCGGNRTTGAGD
jgi:hypothetical protein